MPYIRPKDSDVLAALASDHEVMLDGPDGFGTMTRDAFIAAVAAIIAASPSTYKLATLDGADKLTSSQDPSMPLSYIAVHDVAANSPTLADGVGTTGDTYQISNGGSRDYGSGSITLAEGDALVYNGSAWQKVPNVANILNGIATAAAARTTLDVPSNHQLLEAASSRINSPALKYDGDNDYGETAHNAIFNFSDGTYEYKFSGEVILVLDSNYADSTRVIISKFGASGNRNWRIYTDSSGLLTFELKDASDNSSRAYYGTVLPTSEILHIAWTFSAANAVGSSANDLKLYVNGKPVSLTIAANTRTAVMPAGTQALHFGKRESTNFFKGHMLLTRLWNRLLSDAEMAALSKGGFVSSFDQYGGAVGGKYTSDFSAGADSVTASGGTAAGNVDGIGGQNDVIRLTVDTANSTHFLERLASLSLGKNQHVELLYYVPSTNSHLDGFSVQNGSSEVIGTAVSSAVLDTWTRWTGEIKNNTGGSRDRLRIYATDGGGTTFQDASGDDVIYFKLIKVTDTGVVYDVRGENHNNAADKTVDLSSNNFVLTNNGAGFKGGRKHVQASSLDLSGIPTSSAGLSTGEVWNNAGVPNIV